MDEQEQEKCPPKKDKHLPKCTKACIVFAMENDAKPSVYIETSIPSYLTARPSNDLRVMANQSATLDWWETSRQKYDLFISEFVTAEASKGHPEAAARRLEAIEDFPELEVTLEVEKLAQALIAEGPLPKGSEIDAYHISVATVNGMHYLLTWNCTHIANAVMRPKVETVCRFHGYEPPIICTPAELP
ncbi:MAG: type II toxin-antitoxin system VapC family toxin [Lentisphaeria bacterium]|nr:type II toxin-antitoxin system VapC family toxin [Lentisphaeria bacterium]